jgi:hypothetical protein
VESFEAPTFPSLAPSNYMTTVPLLDRAGVVLLTKRALISARFDRITLTLLHRSA